MPGSDDADCRAFVFYVFNHQTDSDTFCLLNHLAVRINGFQFAGNLCQWHTFCLSIDHCNHAAVIFLNDCLCCCRAKSGTEHSVIWTWASAPLCMSRNRNTDLNACCFINLIRNLIGNGRILRSATFALYAFFVRDESSLEIAPSATARIVNPFPAFVLLVD